MTLAQIYKLALRQLDEDLADIDEFRDLFEAYLNEGYQLMVNEYLRPRRVFDFVTDEHGIVDLFGLNIREIVAVKNTELNVELHFHMMPDGNAVKCEGFLGIEKPVRIVAIVEYPNLHEMTDVPLLPEELHMALVDYICYRYKMTGNLAKQNQAQAYLSQFQAALSRIKPDGSGSVTRRKNLYQSTSLVWPY